MTRSLHALALAAALAAGATGAQATLKVMTSTTDLADLAKAVGGSRITVSSIGAGYQDPHFVEAKPSFIVKLQQADVWAFVGLDLEIGWMPVLLDGARNPNIKMGGSGYIDVSRAVPVLDIPSGNVDRSQGDVHPLGNPHYWLDPDNAKRIVALFRARFTDLDPSGAPVYAANEAKFDASLDSAEKTWAPMLAKIKGKPIVAWHTSWRYFAEYSGVNIVAFMEPKPGVPPSPSHLAGVIQTMKRTGAKVIVMEPFYDKKMADFVADKTGAKVLILPPSVGGLKDGDPPNYIALMTYDITQLADSLP
ncbi:MAG TPA: metal ABC transporter substrate-binding protein [Gemmatimonadaceae bacterium]|nr:metal ABC transporter substrate-binding protein [Gemmatimonadaceae bacterium]